jgi:integrase
MLIYTGFRIDELLSLTPFSVDLSSGIITWGMKTDAGRDRAVPIHSKILPYVKKWLARGGDTLICNPQGKRYTAGNFRNKHYYRALENIGVSRLPPHSTRHTFASLAFEAKIDTLAVQRIIGHADYSTTANIYTHVDSKYLKKELEKLN